MDTATEDQTAGSLTTTMIYETYDFTAPQWYDLEIEDTRCDKQRSELWFESETIYTSSPRRSFKVDSMCNFSQVEESTQLKVIVLVL
ncbi:unnamed protein product [Eruca vesicaria subsp. sativa]|uniref:Uncharacterized protein n=1 Tax=Eruca vesicaria subsp. sativa TaxID=29727 RepID=A0ABC8LAY6_ERUVS|nr:unnamed protein product [Eruca vesicaria subsp. sativa]